MLPHFWNPSHFLRLSRVRLERQFWLMGYHRKIEAQTFANRETMSMMTVKWVMAGENGLWLVQMGYGGWIHGQSECY